MAACVKGSLCPERKRGSTQHLGRMSLRLAVHDSVCGVHWSSDWRPRLRGAAAGGLRRLGRCARALYTRRAANAHATRAVCCIRTAVRGPGPAIARAETESQQWQASLHSRSRAAFAAMQSALQSSRCSTPLRGLQRRSAALPHASERRAARAQAACLHVRSSKSRPLPMPLRCVPP